MFINKKMIGICDVRERKQPLVMVLRAGSADEEDYDDNSTM